MTETEKIVTKIKEYILKLYPEGYSTHQNLVASLKDGVDLFVGRKNNAATIKDEILTACLQELDERSKVYDKGGHLKMIATIRSQFIQFVNRLDVNEFGEVFPIPFERRLTNDESKQLEFNLKTKFDFGSWKDENYYWEPIAKTKNKVPLIYFDEELFKLNEIQKLIEIITSISSEKIFFLTDENKNYEVATATFTKDWIESAYTNFRADWLIYISHEGTITFSGEKLITEIKNHFKSL